MTLPQENGMVHLSSPYSVPETVTRLEGLLQSKGLTLFCTVDHSGAAEKVSLKMPPTQVVLFGSPKAGTPLMIASPTLAIDLPLKALIWEDAGGKVWVSYNSAEYLKHRHNIPDELVKNIAGIQPLLEKLVEKADRKRNEMSEKLSGKVVLVAGGTGGLGRAVSVAFVEQGAKVNVTYQNQNEIDSLRSAAGTRTSSLEGYRVDVTDEAAVRQLVDDLLAAHGRLDVLVNTVGGYTGGIKLWDLDTKDFDRMLAVNLRSGYALSRAAVPAMRKQGRGSIVNIASKAGIDHAAGAAAYAASKAAALAMMDSLAAELTGTGVRVNSILPSIIDTEANRKAMPKADFAKWPKPEDIARVILFLCSDDAKVVHGASMPVYGNS